MDRYEDQPAEVLLRDLFDLGRKTTWTVDDQIEYDEDVAAIKIAVIREASVGVGEIGCHWIGEDEGGSFAQTVTTTNADGEREDIAEGNYDLIPKETP